MVRSLLAQISDVFPSGAEFFENENSGQYSSPIVSANEQDVVVHHHCVGVSHRNRQCILHVTFSYTLTTIIIQLLHFAGNNFHQLYKVQQISVVVHEVLQSGKFPCACLRSPAEIVDFQSSVNRF